MTVELHLYEPCAKGIKYLLAQSPDTESLVPGVSEAEWEDFGRRKGVKVRACPKKAEELRWSTCHPYHSSTTSDVPSALPLIEEEMDSFPTALPI